MSFKSGFESREDRERESSLVSNSI